MILDRLARSAYHTSRGLSDAWHWYRDSDERSKFVHILEAVNYVKIAGLPPVYFEFGCHSGRTFSAALQAGRFLKLALDAYAFDAFSGLPPTHAEQDGTFKEGTFCTTESRFRKIVKRKTGVDLPADHVIAGYYDQTLTQDLSQRLPQSVGFVHVDVDLYGSTIPVLEFVRSRFVNGTVLLFDDWYAFPPGNAKGEKKAFEEFCARYPDLRFEEWKNYSGFGKSMFVTAM